MAAVISDFGSDFGTDSSRSHYHRSRTMRTSSGQQRSPAGSPYRQTSRSRVEPPPSPRPQPREAPIAAGTPPPSTPSRAVEQDTGAVVDTDTEVKTAPPPSPPLSSNSNPGSYTRSHPYSQESFPPETTSSGQSPSSESATSNYKPPTAQAPADSTFGRPTRSFDDVKSYGGDTIKVRDLAHIQSFANEDFLNRGKFGRRRATDDAALKYEISGMPITDIIEMVAGLLTKITTTNDQQHETLNRPIPPSGDSVNISGLSSSVLAFHGKNVPSITILSYLSRIHKYCPTTYEVFLSLLVYFDRMTERVNAAPMQALRRESMEVDNNSRPSTGYSADGSDLADDSDSSPPPSRGKEAEGEYASPSFPLSHFFVVDSFNIHRLVIAGVTCASKFFSDVFYTNSRYAKVSIAPVYLIRACSS